MVNSLHLVMEESTNKHDMIDLFTPYRQYFSH